MHWRLLVEFSYDLYLISVLRFIVCITIGLLTSSCHNILHAKTHENLTNIGQLIDVNKIFSIITSNKNTEYEFKLIKIYNLKVSDTVYTRKGIYRMWKLYIRSLVI